MKAVPLALVVVLSIVCSLAYSAENRPEVAYSADPDAVTASPTLVETTQELIMHALAFIGVQYKWGGKTPDTGLDCSGFVRHVFKDAVGILLPHTAYSMSLRGKSIGKNQLQPGDLVFFNTLKRAFSHVGIYLGDNRFIHAPRTGKHVAIGSLSSSYWAKRFNGGRRVVETAPEVRANVEDAQSAVPETLY